MYDQRNPKVFGALLKRISELGSRYYVNAKGNIMLYWNGGWVDYDYVAQREEKYVVKKFQT